MTGYRLTEGARRDLRGMGVELDAAPEPEELSTEDEDGCLTSGQIDILSDIYVITSYSIHYTKLYESPRRRSA